MGVCTPNIVGPLSELNHKIHIQGQLANATVTISALPPNARVVAQGVVPSSDYYLDLRAGEALHRVDRLVAKQEFNGQPSLPTPDSEAMGVQPAPQSVTEIGHVGYETHLYECGEAIWVSGAIPGAQIEASFGGAVHGGGEALEGNARFGLDTGLRSGAAVTAHQIIAGLPPGPDTPRAPDPLPVPVGQPLPPPSIQPPLKACQASVAVVDVFDGAHVSLKRTSGPQEEFVFDRSGHWLTLQKPLVEGETITGMQSFRRCERQGKDSAPAAVDKATPIEIPAISGKLCAGSTRVPVDGLIPGAEVQILVGVAVGQPSEATDGQAPADAVSFPFRVPPLPAKAVVAVRQKRCGKFSDPSPSVKVDAQASVPTAPKILGQLLACGRGVFVNNVQPNAPLQVFSRTRADTPISDMVSFETSFGFIPVSPYLTEGDDITVAEWACGAARLDSTPPVHVDAHPPLDPTHVKGVDGLIVSGATAVQVTGAVPGASVEVFVDVNERPTFRGRGIASPPPGPTIVYLGALKTGDRVRAQQFLCELQSAQGDPETVVIPPPLKPVLVAPTANATGVAKRPTLSWNDPGAGQERRAASFQVEIRQGNVTVIAPTSVSTTAFLVGTDLKDNTKYTWLVRAINSTGTSDTASADFTTASAQAPPPSKPNISVVYTGPASSAKFSVKGSGFLPSHAVHIRVVNTSTLQNFFFQASSDSAGALQQEINFAATAGVSFAFSANDERQVPTSVDITGTLWSNTVTITAS
jgi:hypothetical protein